LILFKDICGKKVEANFEGREVSSDARLLFLREVERQVGLFHRVAEVLQDRRHPDMSNIRSSNFSINGSFRLPWVMKTAMILMS
jgi:hypothetical protein